MRWLALALAIMMSGCLAEVTEDPWEVPQTLYVTPLESLHSLEPATTDVPLDWDCNDYQQGNTPPTWHSAPMGGDVLVTKATLHVRYLALGDATQCFPRNEWTAWFGTQDAYGTHPQIDGPPFVRNGEIHDVEFELALPPGGLVVPEGEPLAVRIAAYYSPAVLALETGYSRLELVASEIELPATESRLMRAREVSVGGFLCTSGTSAPGAPGTANVTFEVLPTDREIHVTTGASGFGSDIDVVILNPDGEYVWGGLSSGDEEQVHLYGSFKPGLWTAQVFACTPSAVTVPIEIDVRETFL